MNENDELGIGVETTSSPATASGRFRRPRSPGSGKSPPGGARRRPAVIGGGPGLGLQRQRTGRQRDVSTTGCERADPGDGPRHRPDGDLRRLRSHHGAARRRRRAELGRRPVRPARRWLGERSFLARPDAARRRQRTEPDGVRGLCDRRPLAEARRGLRRSGQRQGRRQRDRLPAQLQRPDPQGQTEALRALPDPGSGFARFSGPCAGTGPCFAKLSQDQTVTATFGPPKGTAITKATIKNPRKKAVFSFNAPGAITGYQCELIRPKPKRKGKRHRRRDARKGKASKPRFSACGAPKPISTCVRAATPSRSGRSTSSASTPSGGRHFKIKKPRAWKHW